MKQHSFLQVETGWDTRKRLSRVKGWSGRFPATAGAEPPVVAVKPDCIIYNASERAGHEISDGGMGTLAEKVPLAECQVLPAQHWDSVQPPTNHTSTQLSCWEEKSNLACPEKKELYCEYLLWFVGKKILCKQHNNNNKKTDCKTLWLRMVNNQGRKTMG